MFIDVNFGSEKLRSEIFFAYKGLKKKNCPSKFFFKPKIYFRPKFFVGKILGPKKILGTKKMLGPKKYYVKKNLGLKLILVSEKKSCAWNFFSHIVTNLEKCQRILTNVDKCY